MLFIYLKLARLNGVAFWLNGVAFCYVWSFLTTKIYDLCDNSFWLNVSGILYEQKWHVALFDSFFSMKTLKRQYFHLRINERKIKWLVLNFIISGLCWFAFLVLSVFFSHLILFLLLFCFNLTVIFAKLAFWKQCEGPVWILRELKWQQLLCFKWHSSNSVWVSAASSLLC